MKPKQAESHLELIIDTQKTISTKRIEKMIKVIIDENKMLRVDNRRLRKRVNKLRERLK